MVFWRFRDSDSCLCYRIFSHLWLKVYSQKKIARKLRSWNRKILRPLWKLTDWPKDRKCPRNSKGCKVKVIHGSNLWFIYLSTRPKTTSRTEYCNGWCLPQASGPGCAEHFLHSLHNFFFPFTTKIFFLPTKRQRIPQSRRLLIRIGMSKKQVWFHEIWK